MSFTLETLILYLFIFFILWYLELRVRVNFFSANPPFTGVFQLLSLLLPYTAPMLLPHHVASVADWTNDITIWLVSARRSSCHWNCSDRSFDMPSCCCATVVTLCCMCRQVWRWFWRQLPSSESQCCPRLGSAFVILMGVHLIFRVFLSPPRWFISHFIYGFFRY